MKRLLLLLTIFSLSAAAQETELNTIKADEITCEYLENLGEGDSDHTSCFKIVFNQLKVKTFLEFGSGIWTKYFLDSSKRVLSVEFVTPGNSPDELRSYLNLFNGIANWIPVAYFSNYQGDMSWAPYRYLGSESICRAASFQSVTRRNFANIDDSYITELNTFISNLAKANQIDIAFVNPSGICLRGDLVQLLFGKSPIIVAHDTNSRYSGVKNDSFGYTRVATPEDYEEIYIPTGMGTTVWISKNDKFNAISEELKAHANR